MINYQPLYHKLFNACTDAIELIGEGKTAAAQALLIAAQQSCEEDYLNAEEKTGE